MSHSCSSIAQAHRKSLRISFLLAALFFFVLFVIAEVVAPHIPQGNPRFGVLAGIVFALLGAANLFFAFFYARSRRGDAWSLAAAVAVVPILFAVSLTDELVLPYFTWDPSGRTIARELQLRKIPADQLAVRQMSRGMQYSLSFYTHAEIKNWDMDHPIEGYLLTGGPQPCGYWAATPIVCERIPFDLPSTGRFLYRVSVRNSADRTSGSGQAHKKE
jgi:hypothetical protein